MALPISIQHCVDTRGALGRTGSLQCAAAEGKKASLCLLLLQQTAWHDLQHVSRSPGTRRGKRPPAAGLRQLGCSGWASGAAASCYMVRVRQHGSSELNAFFGPTFSFQRVVPFGGLLVSSMSTRLSSRFTRYQNVRQGNISTWSAIVAASSRFRAGTQQPDFR